ncbi:DNA-binding transcription repressor [Maudiozyma humilis]|uniref:DNA-binding transcription repressor n=1 Tax=Maudiozyma humilis TaxID=51915 RepID=A0AAV5RQG8_MAUHU|nr:DNA-binding transcription repressor [Kazachstania humilis]
MSLSAPSTLILPPPSDSRASSAAREPSRTFFDDLLLPSVSHRVSKARTNRDNAASPHRPLLSMPGSPQRSLPHPFTHTNTTTGPLSLTAPASPHHYYPAGSKHPASTFLTPTSSPGSLGGSPHVHAHLNHFPVPNEQYGGNSNEDRRSLALLTQLNETLAQPNVATASPTSLPPLRHLQLLPDPRVQEHAHAYPDTSERTPHWHEALVAWCRRDAASSYAQIQRQAAPGAATRSGYTNLSAAIAADEQGHIPSVLEARDAFQQLADARGSGKGKGTHAPAAPVTPPMSPRRRRSTDSPVEEHHSPDTQFSPFVSEKLVQHVKGTPATTASTSTAAPTASSHKKSNSFKALQIKHLLDNRDVLSTTSKKVTKRGARKSRAPVSPRKFYTASTLASPSRSAAQALGPRGQGQLVMRLSRESSAHSSDSEGEGREHARARSPARARGRSASPVRRRSGAATPPTPKYHRFPVGSSPSSPARHGDITVTQGAIPPLSLSLSLPQPLPQKAPKSRAGHGHGHAHRVCVSCHSSDSPCWRPSWSARKQDQLCNSCGLRYKKTHTRCLNDACRKIPTKGELNMMRANGVVRGAVPGLDGEREGYRCLFCNTITETAV